MKRLGLFIPCICLFFSLLFCVPAAFAISPYVPDMPDEFIELCPADLYPDFEYNGLQPSCAACPHPNCDPEYSFFAKGGKKNRLVIYFQGGGACWDSKNCLYAPTYSQAAPPLADFDNTTGKGIFDTDNPQNPFKNWFFVYLPYCTGDVHWGANDQPYIDYLGIFDDQFGTIDIRHRGFVNFQVVLKWIKENFAGPEKIFITGSSAGGYGAIMGFPYVKEAYPNASVYVVGDAANGVVDDYFQNQSIYNWNIQIPTWVPGFEGGYDPSTKMEDIYVNFADYYSSSLFGQFTTAWDWNQTFFYNVMMVIGNYSTAPPPANWVPHVEEWNNYFPVWCAWNDQMLEMSYNAADAAPNYKYYIAAGDYHTIMMRPQFYTEDSGGMSFAKWIKAMINKPFYKDNKGGQWQNMKCQDCDDPMPCP